MGCGRMGMEASWECSVFIPKQLGEWWGLLPKQEKLVEDQALVGACGGQEVSFRQVNLETPRDIQAERWRRHWEPRGEVAAQVRPGRHQCVDQQVLALYVKIIKELFKNLYF